MALKDLLVHLDQAPEALRRLRSAADLACRHDARLTALFVNERTAGQLEESSTAEMALASAQDIQRFDQGIQASLTQSVERLRTELRGLERERGLNVRWLAVSGIASDVVLQHARYSDLCIVGHGGPSGPASIDYSFPEQLLFVSGRPIILIPDSQDFGTLGRHLAVAWNASRPSTRALHDALPLIERADRTTVITINPADLSARPAALPTGEVLEHLRRHTAAVGAAEIANVPRGRIAETLQAKAHELGCDLLIAGAFGHARLREKLLGSVTEGLLLHARLPLMMSH
jgi:nucleotide-binding universal stress UspA family protein